MSFIRVNTTVRKYKVVVQGIKWRTTANGGTLYSIEEMEAALPGMFYEFMLPQNHPDMESRTGSLLVLQNGTDGTDQIATVGNLIYLKETDGHFRVIQARNKYTVIDITDWNDIEFTGEGTYILKDVAAATHRPTIFEAPGDGVTKQYNCTLIGNDDSWTLLMFTGSKKYVWDFKSNTITEMASGTGGGGTGGNVTYTNPNKVPTTLGGITANTTFSEKTMQEMWDMLLYPEAYPKVYDPTYNVTCPTNIAEVGALIPVNLANSFSRGSIEPIYIYDEVAKEWKSGGNIPRVGEPAYSGHVDGNYTIALGTNTYSRTATFAQGQQPKTSKGNDHLKPYPENETTGTMQRSVTINGVYPVFSRKATTLVKLALQAHGTAIKDIEVGEGSANEVVIQVPAAWWDNWTAVTVKVWDTLQNDYVPMVNPLLSAPETVDLTINGQTVSYKQYKLIDDSGANKFQISK